MFLQVDVFDGEQCWARTIGGRGWTTWTTSDDELRRLMGLSNDDDGRCWQTMTTETRRSTMKINEILFIYTATNFINGNTFSQLTTAPTSHRSHTDYLASTTHTDCSASPPYILPVLLCKGSLYTPGGGGVGGSAQTLKNIGQKQTKPKYTVRICLETIKSIIQTILVKIGAKHTKY